MGVLVCEADREKIAEIMPFCDESVVVPGGAEVYGDWSFLAAQAARCGADTAFVDERENEAVKAAFEAVKIKLLPSFKGEKADVEVCVGPELHAIFPVSEHPEVGLAVCASHASRVVVHVLRVWAERGLSDLRCVGSLRDGQVGESLNADSVVLFRVSAARAPVATRRTWTRSGEESDKVAMRRGAPISFDLEPGEVPVWADEAESLARVRLFLDVFERDFALSQFLRRVLVFQSAVVGSLHAAMLAAGRLTARSLGLAPDSPDPFGTDGYVDAAGEPVQGPFERAKDPAQWRARARTEPARLYDRNVTDALGPQEDGEQEEREQEEGEREEEGQGGGEGEEERAAVGEGAAGGGGGAGESKSERKKRKDREERARRQKEWADQKRSRGAFRVVPEGLPENPPWPGDEDRRPVVVVRTQAYPRELEDSVVLNMFKALPSPWRAGVLASGEPALEKDLPVLAFRRAQDVPEYRYDPTAQGASPVQFYSCRHDYRAVVSLLHAGPATLPGPARRRSPAEEPQVFYVGSVLPTLYIGPDVQQRDKVRDDRSRAFYKLREALVLMGALRPDPSLPAGVAPLTADSFHSARVAAWSRWRGVDDIGDVAGVWSEVHTRPTPVVPPLSDAPAEPALPSAPPAPLTAGADGELPAGQGPDGLVAVDVGAAPGGWSEFLAEHCGVRTVYAVDPAELAPDMPPNVVHMRMTGAAAIQILLRDGIRADVLVCDMNIFPNAALDILEPLLPVLRPGALVVITFKHCVFPTGAIRHTIIHPAALRAQRWLERLSVRFQLSNGREVTLLGIYKPPQ
jgi:FtsJ-like methyltransferase